MGAWGYETLDSDQALDWIGPIADHAAEATAKTLKDFDAAVQKWDTDSAADIYAHDLRAAGYTLVKLNFYREREYGDLHKEVADRLDQVLKSNWLHDWDDPDAVRANIEKEVAALREGQHGTTLMDNLDEMFGGSDA